MLCLNNPSLTRHDRPCGGYPRLVGLLDLIEVVDGRHKACHDGGWVRLSPSANRSSTHPDIQPQIEHFGGVRQRADGDHIHAAFGYRCYRF